MVGSRLRREVDDVPVFVKLPCFYLVELNNDVSSVEKTSQWVRHLNTYLFRTQFQDYKTPIKHWYHDVSDKITYTSLIVLVISCMFVLSIISSFEVR